LAAGTIPKLYWVSVAAQRQPFALARDLGYNRNKTPAVVAGIFDSLLPPAGMS